MTLDNLNPLPPPRQDGASAVEAAPSVPEANFAPADQPAPEAEQADEQTPKPGSDGPAIGEILSRTIFTRDNLYVLRGMNSDTVDLIYLDPPFNSNRDYNAPIGSKAAGAAFKDTWTLSDVDLAYHEELERTNPAVHSAILGARQTAGDSTMSYLLMMAPRLLEMKRVLKPTGSIYLHCDDTESHYLKMVMDAIFGRRNFRNEIIRKRTAGRSDAKKFGRVHDVILYYAGDGATWNTQWMPHDPAYVERAYRNEDDRGRWQSDQLTASGPSGGESGEPWRDIDPGRRGNHWRTPTKGGMNEFLKGFIPGWPDAYPTVHDRLDALDEHGFIHWPSKANGMPRLKRYLASTSDVAVEDIFFDIGKLEAASKEKVNYPTQKPTALLERIIAASSNPGDVVLDPFCGCATTAIAAEKLGRRWVGIDLGAKAMEMTEKRLRKDLGLRSELAIHRTDQPRRSDLGKLPKPSVHKPRLWGEQNGLCAGCGEFFHQSGMAVDHFVPKSKGGHDHIDNLQLLCTGCNSEKGDRPMSFLMARLLKRRNISYDGKVEQIVAEHDKRMVEAGKQVIPDGIREALADAGLDPDSGNALMAAFLKAVADHKGSKTSDDK